MQISFIGCGAGGNKVAINLLEKEIINRKNTTLVNSTYHDIPEEYRDISIIFSENTMGGCGKERDRGKSILLSNMQSEKLNFDSIPNPGDQMIVLCSSVEGGSGSASVTILAKYFKEVLGLNVCLILIFGFEDDVRGMQNSIEVCQELSDQYTIIGISNKKFLSDAGKNKIRAEKLANDEIARRMRIILGSDINESDHNIDETDLYKMVTMPGYMDCGYIELPKLKNINQFNDVVTAALDNSKSLDISNPSAKRLGVIFNISDKIEDYIDLDATVIRDRFGMPYEFFYHIQYSNDGRDFIEFVASGMDMPSDEIIEVFERYKANTNMVKKTRDSFFDTIGDLRGESQDAMFNIGSESQPKKVTQASKDSFFKGFDLSPKPKSDSKFSNTKVKEDI